MEQTVQEKKKIVDVVMTEELRARLSSYDPITVLKVFKYVPKIYREKDDKGEYRIPKQFWPVFTLKELSGKDRIEVDPTEYHNDGSHSYNMAKSFVNTVRKGVIGWSNWYSLKDGTENVFQKHFRINGELTDEALSIIPEFLYAELVNAIDRRSILSPEEESGL